MTEGIHQDRVTAWLMERVPTLAPPLTFTLIAGGHSNLTYRCEDQAGHALVLRRPPLGHVLESAHDMGREHKIIDALEGSAVPVPRNFGVCKDKSVNEADFYVMEFIDGLVLNDATVSEQLSAEDRRSISENVAEILCQLHRINPDEVGLGDLGRKEAYLERQVKRWVKQWEASKTHEIPEMEESCRLLQERMPEQIGATIVHGDYRLGNMIVRDGRVQAILDWELCTLGDPLADVGYILNNWVTREEVLDLDESDRPPTAIGGFFTRDEFTSYYEQHTGRDLSLINYYRAFSHWRLAAIGQGVYKRYLVGAMGEDRDVDLERQKTSVSKRAESALALLS